MIARAVASCHKHGIVHLYICMSNIVIGLDLVPRLIDFSGAFANNEPSGLIELYDMKYARPPEHCEGSLIRANLEMLKAHDVWSLGVLFYIAVFLDIPLSESINWKQ